MTNYLTSVTLTIHNGDTITFADTADYKGGSAVWSMLVADKDVLAKDSIGKTIFVPFHSVIKAEMTRTTSEGEDPQDDFCVEVTEENVTPDEPTPDEP